MNPQLFTVAERPKLADRLDELGEIWPEFLTHDEVLNARWDELYDRWPEYQLVLVDEEADVILGKGNTMPVEWDGRVETLTGGVVEVFERQFERPNVLCAIVAIIAPGHQGQGLSGHLIEGMARVAGAHGLECLIAPVRPTSKDRYPLTPLEEYVGWKRDDGLPFDPWLRLHHRLGAEQLAIARRSLDIRGTVARWEEWTGMAFPVSGDYIVKGALVPVRIDRERDEGRYVEPNVWMRHEAAGPSTRRNGSG